MRHVTTVIIGAGQSGLAMSKHLTDRSIDHVLLERGEVANSWQKERWDSLRLLTPNWQSRLPGYAYEGDDPDGYMSMPEIVDYLKRYAGALGRTCSVALHRLRACAGRRRLRGRNRPRILALPDAVHCERRLQYRDGAGFRGRSAAEIASLTPMDYRNPGQLPDGGVMIVGASATGVQLADEIQRLRARSVMLAAGEHVRVPRIYRGRDIKWWMDAIGAMDVRYDEVDDIGRARRLPSLQLIGTPERETHRPQQPRASAASRSSGALSALRDGKAQFSGSLANHCGLADLKMNRLLASIDAWISRTGKRIASTRRIASSRRD